MKTTVVQAILFTDSEITTPLFQVHCRISGQWKYTGVMLSSKKSLCSIDGEMSLLRLKITQSETDSPFVNAIDFCL